MFILLFATFYFAFVFKVKINTKTDSLYFPRTDRVGSVGVLE